MISENDKNKSSDFSIDHILNRAGSSSTNSDFPRNAPPLDPYSWLQCTRYCPPKVPRSQRKDGQQKRQLGRHPRIPFTSHQLSLLEEKFQRSPYLSSEEVIALSKQLQLADVRVKIWFQNRRARERREKLVQVSGDNDSRQQSGKMNLRENSSVCATVQPIVHESSLQNILQQQSAGFLQTHLGNYFVSVPGFVCAKPSQPGNDATT